MTLLQVEDVNKSSNSSSNSSSSTSSSRKAVVVADKVEMRSQTCVEFLSIMKEFTESHCNAKEMIQRVDSLVHQDEHLLRLLPFAQPPQPEQQQQQQQEEEETKQLENQSPNALVDSPKKKKKKKNPSSPALQTAHLKSFFSNLAPLPTDTFTTRGWMELELDLDIAMDYFLEEEEEEKEFVGPLRVVTKEEQEEKKMTTLMTITPTASAFPSKKQLVHRLNKSPGSKNHHRKTTSCSQNSRSGSQNSSKPSRPRKQEEEEEPVDVSLIETSVQFGVEEEENVWGMEEDEYEFDLLATIDHEILCDRENRFLQWDLHRNQQQQQQQQHLETSHRRKLTTSHLNKQQQPPSSLLQQQQQLPTEKTAKPKKPLTTTAAAGASSSFVGLTQSPSRVEMVEDWHLFDLGQNRTVSHILNSCLQKRKLQHPYKNQVKLVNFNVPGSKKNTSTNTSSSNSTSTSTTSSSSSSSCSSQQNASKAEATKAPLQTGNLSAAIAGTVGGSLATSLAFGGGVQDLELPLPGILVNSFVEQAASATSISSSMKPSKSELATKKAKKREERKRLMNQRMQETLAELEGTFREHDLDLKHFGGLSTSSSACLAGNSPLRMGGSSGDSAAFLLADQANSMSFSNKASSNFSSTTNGNPSKLSLSKLDSLPLPDLTNLPQDLRELKRKIELTEHKVEGTKHRHRKGGPCPRCQVQNQLRAAKRAYHKRAVAHKKLPQGALATSVSSSITTSVTAAAGGGAGISSGVVVASPMTTTTTAAQGTPVVVSSSSGGTTTNSFIGGGAAAGSNVSTGLTHPHLQQAAAQDASPFSSALSKLQQQKHQQQLFHADASRKLHDFSKKKELPSAGNAVSISSSSVHHKSVFATNTNASSSITTTAANSSSASTASSSSSSTPTSSSSKAPLQHQVPVPSA